MGFPAMTDTKGLERFNRKAFQRAGHSSTVYDRFVTIATQEKTHVAFLCVSSPTPSSKATNRGAAARPLWDLLLLAVARTRSGSLT